MTWEIINATKDSIEIIEDIVYDVRKETWKDSPLESDDIQDAWDRVKDLTKKGIIAEKYMKEWGKE